MTTYLVSVILITSRRIRTIKSEMQRIVDLGFLLLKICCNSWRSSWVGMGFQSWVRLRRGGVSVRLEVSKQIGEQHVHRSWPGIKKHQHCHCLWLWPWPEQRGCPVEVWELCRGHCPAADSWQLSTLCWVLKAFKTCPHVTNVFSEWCLPVQMAPCRQPYFQGLGTRLRSLKAGLLTCREVGADMNGKAPLPESGWEWEPEQTTPFTCLLFLLALILWSTGKKSPFWISGSWFLLSVP